MNKNRKPSVWGFLFAVSVLLIAFPIMTHYRAQLFALSVVGFWIVIGLFFWFRGVVRLAHQAFRPIMSPAQIEAQLIAEGYNPSLQDVLAVEQHLRNQRNDALIGVGALYLATHNFSENFNKQR